MLENPNIREALIAGAAVLAVVSVLFWYLSRLAAPAGQTRHGHSLESRLLGVVSGRLRELERRPYAELEQLPPTQREDKVSPSGRRFYIRTIKERAANGALAITVQVVEIKALGRGVRVSETLHVDPPSVLPPPPPART